MRVEKSLNPALERAQTQDGVKKTEDQGFSRYDGTAEERSKGGRQPVYEEKGGTDRLVMSRSLLELQREELQEKPEWKHALSDEEKLREELEESLEKLNEEAERDFLNLRFKLHEDSERWMVQVVDVLEDEVIREIPPEKILDVSARITEMIGVMLDQRR